MYKKVCKKIYKLIKKYDSIVIARHVGPDPDALGSQLALKETIATTFPNKKVYAVGHPASRFKYLGDLDGIDEEIMSKSLLIILDTPNKNRVDGLICNPAYSIKIDHHPFVEEFCNLEWIDDSSCSAAQLVLELIFNTDLKLNSSIASKIYTGIIADTNRFLFSYTSSKTFSLVSKLIRDTNFDFVSAYNDLYLRPLKEVKFEGYIINNMTITDNGFAYLKITQDMLDLYGVDAATAGNMVNNFNYIEEVLAWAVFTVDNNNGGTIRGNIRSRGPIINEVAANYGGGGHKLASGVRLKSFEEVDNIVADLDKVCALFK